MKTLPLLATEKISALVYKARLLGTVYRIEMGRHGALYETPIVTYREGNRWVPCSDKQRQFIVDAVLRRWGGHRSNDGLRRRQS